MILTFGRIRKLIPILLILLAAVFLSSHEGFMNTLKDPGGLLNTAGSKLADSVADRLIGPDSDEDSADLDETLAVVTIRTSDKEHEVIAEQARTLEEITMGLMYREELCPDCGMLFYYPSETLSSFWMKNCRIPLDILFIATDGTIVDIKENFEPCEEDPCPAYQPATAFRYALEVNGGWVEGNDIVVGEKAQIEDV